MALQDGISNCEIPAGSVIAKRANGGYVVRYRSGKVIGSIVNGTYVPRDPSYVKPDTNKHEIVSFGGAALILSIGIPTLVMLAQVFPLSIATQIFVLSCLKVLYPYNSDQSINNRYKESFLSVAFPGCPLSPNTLSKLYEDLGNNSDARKKFYNLKMDKFLSEFHIMYVDGSLEQLTSSTNSLSQASYKKKHLGFDVINVIRGYSLEENDILCSSVYPGNFSDTSVYKKFLIDNDIHKGIMFGDSAFVPSIVKNIKTNCPGFEDLEYIGLWKKNDVRIPLMEKINFSAPFESSRGNVIYKKYYDVKSKTWFFCFKNENIANDQQHTFLKNAMIKNDPNFGNEYEKIKDRFGIIYVESSVNFEATELYKIILDRWSIEVVIRKSKSDLEFDCTRKHTIYHTLGSKFVESVSLSLFLKVCDKIDESGIKGKRSYRECINDLNETWRKVNDIVREAEQTLPSWIFNEGMPISYDYAWVNTSVEQFGYLEALNLSKPNDDFSSLQKSRPTHKRSENGINGKTESENDAIKEFIDACKNMKEMFQKNHHELFESEKNDLIEHSSGESTTNKVGRPIGSLNKSTIDKNNNIVDCVNTMDTLIGQFESLLQKTEKADKKTSKTDSSDTINEAREPKSRKQRSDKGKKRGHNKRTLPKQTEQQSEDYPVFDSVDNFFDQWWPNATEAPNSTTLNQDQNTESKRKPGRPKGSLNKKTLAKLEEQRIEALREIFGSVDNFFDQWWPNATEAPNSTTPNQDQNTESKRKPGRPKGSLNKKTLAKLEEQRIEALREISGSVDNFFDQWCPNAAEAPNSTTPNQDQNTESKRKPGRPKGSLNKKTLAKLAEANTQTNS